jgi:ribose transport system permease protein
MTAAARSSGRQFSWRSALSFRTIGGVYVLLLLVIVFGILEPDTFLRTQTIKTVLNQYAVSGLLALSLVVPLSAGIFDLSLGAQASLASVTVAVLISQHHLSVPVAIMLTIVVGVLVGFVNVLVVVGLRIDSFIGTLGTGAILGALAVGVSGNKTITGPVISGSFQKNIALRNLDGVTIPVLYLLVVTLVLGYLLERTKSGRHWYAIGFDTDAARLAGVRVRGLSAAALIVASVIAAIAGMTLTARVASGTPGAGAPYLLTAFAGAFLGATQFRHGRFNPWGTLLAVLLIGTGEYGIGLTDAPQWAPEVFDGVVLIAAVGITNLEGGRLHLPPWMRNLRRPAAVDPAGGDAADADGAAVEGLSARGG